MEYEIKTIAVLGAGNGGCTAAGDLSRRGYEVRLYSRSQERLLPVVERGGIELTGRIGDGLVPISIVTNDIVEAVNGADLIMVVVPGPGHEFYARKLASVLAEDQIIMLNPGQCGGGLHFSHVLREAGYRGKINICETNSLTYGCRLIGPAKVSVYVPAKRLLLAGFPGDTTQKLLELISPVYPALVGARDVLETGLLYLNGILHPAGMVLNSGWIENTEGDFKYYYEGTTPAVARAIEAVDRERVEVMKAVGLPGTTFIDIFYGAGYTTREAASTGSIYEAMHASEPNKARQAPADLRHRYMDEDIGHGIVPMSEIARAVGKATPAMDALITLASTIMGVDYRDEGLNLRKLGLLGLSKTEIQVYIMHGWIGRSNTEEMFQW